MKWKVSLRSLFLLVVFCVACSLAYGNDLAEMTDLEILTELKTNLDARESLIVSRETDLSLREARLSQRETDLQTREESLIAIGSFSQSLRDELKQKRNSDYWRGFAHGSATGFFVGSAAGGYLGFKIGVNL